MKYLITISVYLTLSLFFNSCSNSDDNSSNTTIEPPRISGGPFVFCVVDDEADFVSGLSVNGGSGDDFSWVVTDEQNVILSIPKTIEDVEAIDFSEAGQGNCRLWLLRFNNPINNLLDGNNLTSDLDKNDLIGLSNFLEVLRTENVEACNTL